MSTLPTLPKLKASLSPAAWVLSVAAHFGFLGTAMVVIMGPGVPRRDKPIPPLIIHPSTAEPAEMVFDEPIVDPPQRQVVPLDIPDLLPPREEPTPQLPEIERPHWVVKAEPLPDTPVPPDTLLVRILPAAAPAPAPAEPASAPEPVAETYSQPAPAQPIRIAYPAYARRRGMEGVVEIEITVDETGVVTALRIVRSSGYPLLDKAALRGLADVRFAPARRNGVAVPDTFRQPVRFELKEGGVSR